MLRKYLWMTAAMGICLAGCQEDALVEEQTQTSGATVEGEIVFSTSGLGSFNEENPQSRTVYGQGYATEDGKWNCPIDWVNGDQVRIYCAQASAPDVKYADYKVTWDGAGENDNVLENSKENGASLEKMTNRPLCWGEAVDHTFYGFYPSSAIQEGDSPKTIKATIPSFQRMTWSNDGGNWTGKPDMDYAFMRAEATVEASDRGKDVTLRFDALTTAVQVTLTASEQVSLSAIQILAESKDKTARQSVCGDFTMNLTTGDIDLTSDGTNNYQITVEARRKISSDDPSEPITLGAGQSLTFTAFLLPETNIQNLKIRVLGVGANGARVKTFANANLTKGSISKIELSDYAPSTGTNNWMEAIDDDVMISQLSIPGSVNAFSREILPDYSYQSNTEMDVTQWITVREQFDAGVRVFEIATEKDGDNENTSLGNAELVAGKETNDNITLTSAFETLANAILENKSEFVIVIPYYTPIRTENTKVWALQLNRFLSVHSDINGMPLVAFNPTMKMGDARGKILVLTRFPYTLDSGDNSLYGVFTNASPTLSNTMEITSFVCEWDTDKDRWWKRGYNTEDVYSSPSNIDGNWYEIDADRYQWQWMGRYNPGEGHYYLDRWKFNAMYKFNNPTNIYVYDWERVCQSSGTYKNLGMVVCLPGGTGASTEWYTSLEEKEEGTKQFIDDAMANLRNGSDMYITSLKGYYIVSDILGVSAQAWQGFGEGSASKGFGRHGDIPPYAQYINNAIYRYLTNSEETEEGGCIKSENRGPLGIMLMDYAGIGRSEDLPGFDFHGDDLLQTIIDNNFRFLLNTSRAE